ncbi:MAG TPA: hypothetical protein VL333_01145 [Candidatus Saccharimonadales bacterium]|jgi:hypothetical protein|nr:hypothetical protein [Candidatus Saccharimonadales bacterium]
MRRTVFAILAAIAFAACTPVAVAPSPSPSASPPPSPVPLASEDVAVPDATPDVTPLPGTTPFPTPGPTITPGSTRVIGTIVHPDGSPAQGICVVLEKGICPIATDAQGIWFTDIPAGPIGWNFIYKIDGQEAGRQIVAGTNGGELRLPVFVLEG